MSDQFFWFATRAAGIMTWFSATLSLGVGLLMSSRALGRRPTIPWLLDVHRFTAAMSVVFLFLHLLTLWADSFVDLTLADFVIPGRAEVPGLTRLSMAWGVIAAWILVVVQGSSLLKNYLPPDWWHTIHLTSFGVVIAGLAHAMQAGSDVDNRLVVALSASLLTAIVLLLSTRILRVLLDRKYQFDRANGEGSDAEVGVDEPIGVDRQAVEVSAGRRGRSRSRSVADVEATNLVTADGVDVESYADVDLDAYAYGDFSHLSGSGVLENEEVDRTGSGPPEVEVDSSVTKRGNRPLPPVVDAPERTWGGPGSFAAPPPERERPPPPRPQPGEGDGPPPIRR